MGKVTGFLEYERLEEGYEPVDKRLKNYKEFVIGLSADDALLKKLVEDHHRWTGSLRAREILDHWAASRAKFVKVFPHEYRRALGEMNAVKEADATIARAKGDVGDAKKGDKKVASK